MTETQEPAEGEIARMLGRPPTAEERAIHADQMLRLGAIWNHPLCDPDAAGLSRRSPFGGTTDP